MIFPKFAEKDETMIQYPIGIQDFQKIIANNMVYVDKTDLVYQLVSNFGVYFLSRPRRFGKSLLVSTIKYYFQGRSDLFKGLKIDKLEHNWDQYPVFEIDFNGKDYTEADALSDTLELSSTNWESGYGRNAAAKTLGDRFAYVLHQAHVKRGKQCVVLIDEYDKPLLDVMDTGLKTTVDGNEMTIEERNRNILKGFYSVFKLADADLRFVFLTGVTKFAQVSVFSGFNNARDISMNPDYDAICGITEDELGTVFHSSIESLAKANDMSYDETKQLLKETYDGYHFSKAMTDIYNPFSLLNCFADKDVNEYWFATATPTYLVRLLAHRHGDMQDIVKGEYRDDEFVNYRVTVEAPVPMIYQSGYLTIKGYDRRKKRYRLDFPNKEVSSGFLTMEAASYFKNDDNRMSSWVDDASIALEDGKIDEFHDMLYDFIASIPYSTRFDNSSDSHEKQFQYTVFLILRLISSQESLVLHEKENSQGRADCILETPNFVYIFEFKLDHPADEALHQIEAKGYAEPYTHDSRKVYRIGCTFSSETGRVSDWKVEPEG